VLDASGRPAADGEIGELHLSGQQVGRGYLGRPELTAAKFVERPGLGRCYATGDLAVRDPAGVLRYRGRPVPRARARRPGRAEFDALAAELTAVVRGVLPDYMTPSAYGFLTARRRPPAAYATMVLGLDAVAADIPFAALGGDSLLAAGVTARLRRRGAAVTLPQFHADPTVAGLARLLPPAPAGGVDLQHEDGPGPVTATLREAWLGEQMAGEQTALWTVPVLVGVDGPLDVPVLQAALDALVVRHDALHTAITGPDTASYVPPYAVPLEVVDVSHLDGAAQDEAASAAQDRESRTPLDLGTGQVLRAQLVRRSESRGELLLHLHHAAADGLPPPRPRPRRPVCRDGAGAGGVSAGDAPRFVAARQETTAAELAERWRARLAGGPPASAASVWAGDPAAGVWDGGRVTEPVDCPRSARSPRRLLN
jgi:hypothetical protein